MKKNFIQLNKDFLFKKFLKKLQFRIFYYLKGLKIIFLNLSMIVKI